MDQIVAAIRNYLKEIGVGKELIDRSPERFAKAFVEMTSSQQKGCVELTTFPSPGNGLVVVRGIRFSSLCEHHLFPFFGSVTIGYSPNGAVIGLSKFARLVETLSRRIQLQEKFTEDIAETVNSISPAPAGVGVKVTAKHSCVSCRGACATECETTTVAVRGDFEMAWLE